jgi:hypothetical protein
MFRFEWAAFVTPTVLATLRAAAGVAPADSLDAVIPSLTSILASTGGVPFIDNEPTEAGRDAWALRLLSEALGHTLAKHGARSAGRGYRIARTGIDELGGVARASALVALNWAGAAEISAATGVSLSLGERIVGERRAGGEFRSLDDLDGRLPGVGARNREHFASAASFDGARALLAQRATATGDLQDDLRSLLDLQAEGTAVQRLTAALEGVAASCALEPHPATRMNRRRTPEAVSPPVVTTPSNWVGVLFGESYYTALQSLFASAGSAIDVCMFHVAYPSDGHPTRRLIDALVAAHARGVAVRVLMDSDRSTDPYRSTLINTRAKNVLDAAGVAVRFDSPERLLHSKFLVIDRKLAIVGSHNWSAGSYFDFDDLTLVVESAALAAELGQRFDALWSA